MRGEPKLDWVRSVTDTRTAWSIGCCTGGDMVAFRLDGSLRPPHSCFTHGSQSGPTDNKSRRDHPWVRFAIRGANWPGVPTVRRGLVCGRQSPLRSTVILPHGRGGGNHFFPVELAAGQAGQTEFSSGDLPSWMRPSGGSGARCAAANPPVYHTRTASCGRSCSRSSPCRPGRPAGNRLPSLISSRMPKSRQS